MSYLGSLIAVYAVCLFDKVLYCLPPLYASATILTLTLEPPKSGRFVSLWTLNSVSVNVKLNLRKIASVCGFTFMQVEDIVRKEFKIYLPSLSI